MEQNFGHMVYHAWQVRLLVATSCCFLVVAGVAHLSFAQTELSYVLGALGCTSLNYWRSPGDSWRRTADLCCASFALVYTFAHGWWGDDTTVVNAVGWTANTFGIFCFRCSWKVSLGNSTHWAVWHAAGHASMLVGSICLAIGSVEDKFSWSLSMWPRNSWAEAGASLVLACLAYDSGVMSHARRLLGKLWQHLRPAWKPTIGSSSPPDSLLREKSLGGYLGKDYVPPLPRPVAEALERSCLCYLATSGENHEPHLSLMRFTYTAGLEEPLSEVLIISTQRKTKKFELITCNNQVALLVHDFNTSADADATNYQQMDGRTRYSITLNGVVSVQEGELAERYRAIHLAANPAYTQFIVGDDIAIITVDLKRARVCDVNDRVTHFARGNSEVGANVHAWSEVSAAPG